MSFEPSTTPDPSGSPLEKFQQTRRGPRGSDFVGLLRAQGVDDDLSDKIGRALGQWETQRHFDEVEMLVFLEQWANRHTHPSPGTFWHSDKDANTVYRLDASHGGLISSFGGPTAQGAWGLDWDGTHLWLGVYTSSVPETIYKLNPDGSVVSSFAAPELGTSDVAWDGTYLWFCAFGSFGTTIYKLDPATGATVSTLAVPAGNRPSGITWDGSHLWVVMWSNGTIYKMNASDGSVVNSFSSPGSRPGGLGWDGTYLLHADSSAVAGGVNAIYKLDPADGSIVATFEAQNSLPHGVAFYPTP